MVIEGESVSTSSDVLVIQSGRTESHAPAQDAGWRGVCPLMWDCRHTRSRLRLQHILGSIVLEYKPDRNLYGTLPKRPSDFCPVTVVRFSKPNPGVFAKRLDQVVDTSNAMERTTPYGYAVHTSLGY